MILIYFLIYHFFLLYCKIYYIRYLEDGEKMAFQPKPTKQKVQAENRSLYIKSELAKKIENLAVKHDTSFNNIVISIIEDFFEKEDAEA